MDKRRGRLLRTCSRGWTRSEQSARPPWRPTVRDWRGSSTSPPRMAVGRLSMWVPALALADLTRHSSSPPKSAPAEHMSAASRGRPIASRSLSFPTLRPWAEHQLYACEAGMRRSRTAEIAPNPGPLHRVTNVVGQLSHPAWSPDGKRLAVLYVAGSAQETGALVAYTPDEGVVGDSVDEQRIAVVDAAGGELRSVSPADMFVYDYDWSPNGQSFAAEAVKDPGPTTTGLRSSMSSVRQLARHAHFGSRRSNWRGRAGRSTVLRSPSFTAS